MVNKRNLPNILTILRGILTVVIVAMFFAELNWKYPAILIMFLVASATDFADGFLARKWQTISTFGVVFDSMLDKVLILVLMMMLIPYKLLPVIVWVLFLIRELVIDSIKSFSASRKQPIKPSRAGKFKMAAEVVVIAICLLRLAGDSLALQLLSEIAAVVGLGLAYYSAAKYIWRFSRAKNGNTSWD